MYAFFLTFLTSAAAAMSPVACTMDAKMCPDGKTYVGRIAPNCEFAACPGEEPKTMCDPYVCADGTLIDRCTPDGHTIYYFAAPCLTHGGEAGAPFEDVTADHAYADAIYYVKEEGIVEGYLDGTFRPDKTINRAEFTKIVIEATSGIGVNALCKIAPFSDSDVGAWYAPYLQAARCSGIAGGYPDGTYRPANSINFVEAAKIIVNAYGLEASTTISACEDDDCPWYRSYAMMLEARGAIPMTITSFDQEITRGEMAEIIYRLETENATKPSRQYRELAGNVLPVTAIRYQVLPLPSQSVRNYARNVVYAYMITAPAESTVTLTEQDFTVEGGRWSGPQLHVFTDAAMREQIDTWASDNNWTEADTAHLFGHIEIPAGGTRYLQLSVQVGTPASQFTLTVTHPKMGSVLLQGGGQ